MKIFSINSSRLIENKSVIEFFVCVPFLNFTFGLHGFDLKKLKMIQYDI